MQIQFQFAAMAPKARCKGEGIATARAKLQISVINRHLPLDRDRMKGFISEHFCGLTRICNVCCIQDDRAWDLFCDIVPLDPVTTRPCLHFQLMWPHRRSRSSPFREWLAAIRSYLGQMCHKTPDQMNHWRWDNPLAFGDGVEHSNPQRTSAWKVIRTCKRFSRYGCDNPRATIELASRRPYKPGDFLVIRPLNWDEVMDEEDDDENCGDPGARIGDRCRPGNGNDHDDGGGEEDTQGSEKDTGTGRATKDGQGKGKATEDGEGKALGKGKGKEKRNGKGKGIVKQTPGEMISLMPLLCSCRRKCMRHTHTQREN